MSFRFRRSSVLWGMLLVVVGIGTGWSLAWRVELGGCWGGTWRVVRLTSIDLRQLRLSWQLPIQVLDTY